MTAYYNEIDKHAAAWLRELIKEGHIANGVVDERSITDVKAHELTEFTQHHFFAGIGGWSAALRLAGWPDNEPVWTGSCPCQPFSIANIEGAGLECERHLWPDWFRLIQAIRPSILFGEQVPNAIEHGWLDEVFADLEMENYECGAAILPANCFGAEHERKRLFWVAHSQRERREGYFEWRGRIPGITPTALANDCDAFAGGRRIMGGDFLGLLPRDGILVQMERNALKGFGNAIVPQAAAAFIQEAIAAIGNPRGNLLAAIPEELA